MTTKRKCIPIFRADRQEALFKKTMKELTEELERQKQKQSLYPVGYLNRSKTDGKVEALEYALRRLESNNDFINEHFY